MAIVVAASWAVKLVLLLMVLLISAYRVLQLLLLLRMRHCYQPYSRCRSAAMIALTVLLKIAVL